MKRFRSEKAFTLVEMSVVLSVVALVGSLLVGGVVTANNNRVSADILEFFDKEIEQANENFKIEPQQVLNNEPIRPEPYQDMQYSNLTGSVPGFQYSGYYTEELEPNSAINTADAKYMLQISFEQEADISQEKKVEGFARQLTSYEMKAVVVELVDKKYDFDHPLLERSYKGISVEGQLDWDKEKDKAVTFNVVDEDEKPATIYNYTTGEKDENSLKVMYAEGDQFYSQKVSVIETKSDSDGGSDKPNKAFVGWTDTAGEKDVIPLGTKIDKAMDVYAIFSEYRVEFQLKEGQQFNPDLGLDNKNYFVEGSFSDFPDGKATIGSLAKDDKAKEQTLKDLLGAAESQVIQAGYEFRGWRDAVTKNPISQSLDGKGIETVLLEEDPYLQLEPVMERIEADKVSPLQLRLNLTDYQVDGRKFFLYGITDMEYKVVYDEDAKTLGVKQTEYNTWNKNREKVSETEFTLGDSYLSIVDENGKEHSDFEQYFKEMMSSGSKYIVLDRVQLTVKAPVFSSKEYLNAPEADKDKVYFNNILVTAEQLKKLDADGNFSADKMKYQSQNADGVVSTLPMDEESSKALNSQLLEWYGENKNNFAQVEVLNVAGSFKYTHNGEASVYQKRKWITVQNESKLKYGSREISYDLVVPLSLLHSPEWFWPVNIKCGLGVDGNNQIYIELNGDIPAGPHGGYYPLFDNGPVRIKTGIPYQETYDGQTIYNRISTINVTADIEQGGRFGWTVQSQPYIIEGNGPEDGEWFPSEKEFKEEYGEDANMKVVGVPDVNAIGDTNSVWGGCNAAGFSYKYCWVNSSDVAHKLKTDSGLYDSRPVLTTNPTNANVKRKVQTNSYAALYPGKTDIPGLSYSGTWFWTGDKEKKFEEAYLGEKFNEKWSDARNNNVVVVGVTDEGTSQVEKNWYSFNFDGGTIKYTTLPANFVCK